LTFARVSLFFPSWQLVAAQDVVPSWYPAEPGDTWVYQREDREGGGRGILNPDIARWTTEETIASSATIPEGRLVLKRVKVLGSLSASVPKYLSDRVPEESIDSHYLVRQNCVYVLDGDDASVESVGRKALGPNDHLLQEFRDALLRGEVHPDMCFPLKDGATWGNLPNSHVSDEVVWTVIGIDRWVRNAFHVSSHQASGTTVDRWFEPGVGIVQETMLHHGTYIENRRQLLRAIIGGKTHSYALTPVRTVPDSQGDCGPIWWRQMARRDARPFMDQGACISYAISIGR
jgi:hypothetical protein